MELSLNVIFARKEEGSCCEEKTLVYDGCNHFEKSVTDWKTLTPNFKLSKKKSAILQAREFFPFVWNTFFSFFSYANMLSTSGSTNSSAFRFPPAVSFFKKHTQHCL
jgi:hypothetical protein